MRDEKKLGLESVSAEELEDFYGTKCNGHGRNCSLAGKSTGVVNSDCCWHDCEHRDGSATKLWTAWG